MEITNIHSFLRYFERVRQRTLKVIEQIPPEKIEWTYHPDKFTFGDIIRHLATIERYMYAENAQFRPSAYEGCGKELAEGYENVLLFLEEKHLESVEIFSRLTSEDLQKKCLVPSGHAISLWKWLRAMVEHEVHHRGQIYAYLGILELEVPKLYGMTSEQVAEVSVRK
ncbi:MAG: DinB family protein [Chitinophagales bacterium]